MARAPREVSSFHPLCDISMLPLIPAEHELEQMYRYMHGPHDMRSVSSPKSYWTSHSAAQSVLAESFHATRRSTDASLGTPPQTTPKGSRLRRSLSSPFLSSIRRRKTVDSAPVSHAQTPLPGASHSHARARSVSFSRDKPGLRKLSQPPSGTYPQTPSTPLHPARGFSELGSGMPQQPIANSELPWLARRSTSANDAELRPYYAYLYSEPLSSGSSSATCSASSLEPSSSSSSASVPESTAHSTHVRTRPAMKSPLRRAPEPFVTTPVKSSTHKKTASAGSSPSYKSASPVRTPQKHRAEHSPSQLLGTPIGSAASTRAQVSTTTTPCGSSSRMAYGRPVVGTDFDYSPHRNGKSVADDNTLSTLIDMYSPGRERLHTQPHVSRTHLKGTMHQLFGPRRNVDPLEIGMCDSHMQEAHDETKLDADLSKLLDACELWRRQTAELRCT